MGKILTDGKKLSIRQTIHYGATMVEDHQATVPAIKIKRRRNKTLKKTVGSDIGTTTATNDQFAKESQRQATNKLKVPWST